MNKLIVGVGAVALGAFLLTRKQRVYLFRGIQEELPKGTRIVRIISNDAADAIAGMRYWYGIPSTSIKKAVFSGKLDANRRQLWDVYLGRA